MGTELSEQNRESLKKIYDLRQSQGRKFDMDNDYATIQFYRSEICAYARTYEGDFRFMVEMRENVISRGKLTVGQLVGVANCMYAEERRLRTNKPSDTSGSPADFADGTYTVVREDGYETIKVRTGKTGHWEGRKIISYLAGPDNEADYVSFGELERGEVKVWKKYQTETMRSKVRAAEFLVRGSSEDVAKAGHQYALVSGRCYKCGRTLTVPASINRGLGPECAKRA